jgi:UDPglucose--hexose-1-phosphate uridylyltransferase
VPKKHSSDFSSIERESVPDLANALQKLIKKLAKALNSPPYNFILHTSPLDEKDMPSYHWHIEVIPRLGKTSGFEWGTGFHVNILSPERCAKYLRDTEC